MKNALKIFYNKFPRFGRLKTLSLKLTLEQWQSLYQESLEHLYPSQSFYESPIP